jgi:pantoate kinase
MTSRAFCPGHITAMFYPPEPGPTPEATGSRGAGVCIALGAIASVTANPSDTTSISAIEGTRLSPVVAAALGELLSGPTGPVDLRLGLELDLPVGHGFGMSGAMTFASLVAAENEVGAVGGDVDRLLAIAHRAEVNFLTGLGDVVAQARGGIDVRLSQGLPPIGKILHQREEAEMVIAWSDRPLHTRSVLDDREARSRLEVACGPLLGTRGCEPSMGWLLGAGLAFSMKAGLVGDEVREMLSYCSAHGTGSQVMLGNSIFAMGDVETIGQVLDEAGYHFRITNVDNEGVRLLR